MRISDWSSDVCSSDLGVDPILGPEMRSTGEVMGVCRSFGAAFARAEEAAGIRAPAAGKVFISVRDPDKQKVLAVAQGLICRGSTLAATRGPAAFLRDTVLEPTGRANGLNPVTNSHLDL